jgi:ABC-type lipoprotein release transport system permease subunit
VTLCLILLAFNLFLFASGVGGFSGPDDQFIMISGKVVDNEGKPILNATVVLLDLNMLRYNVTTTDGTGYYNATVPQYDRDGNHTYAIYAFHQDPASGRIDYVPAVYPEDVYNLTSRVRENCTINFTLYPGATVFMKSELWYILSLESPWWYTFEVLNSTSKDKPSLGENTSYISVYGAPPYKYEEGPDARFLNGVPPFNGSLVVVPAQAPVFVNLKALFRNERTNQLEVISFSVYWNGQPIYLTQGEAVTVDVRTALYEYNVLKIEGVIQEVEKHLTEMQETGFFVGAERDDLGNIRSIVESAKDLLPPRKLYPEDNDFTQARNKLEEAIGCIRLLEARLNSMHVLAVTHCLYFPFFFAVFTVIFSSFLFENDRKKIVTAIILYPIIIAALFYIYPGFSLIFKETITIKIPLLELTVATVAGSALFLVTTAIAITVVLLVFFLFPMIYRPPLIEGKTSLRSVVSVIFSMGKRNVKRRKLRSFFCILTIMILVLSFTALTSFSSVLGVVKEKLGPTPVDINGVLLQKIPHDETNLQAVEHFFTLREVQGLWDYGAKNIACKVENLPYDKEILFIKAPSGKTASIYGVIGVQPSVENNVTKIGNYITEGELTDEDDKGLVLSKILADRLEVKTGDPLQVYSVSGGVRSNEYVNFTVEGYLDDSIFQLDDINGRPFVPLMYVGTELKKTNQTQTVMFIWETALNVTERMGISRVVVFLEDTSPGKIDEFANRITLHREYVAWAFENGQLTKYYIGERFEVKGFAQFIIPFTIVVLNVAVVMLNIIYERRREVHMLATLGLNPSHIASLFLAESIIMGFIGGGLGYFFGLGAYRLMPLLGPSGQIGVREKLEWYWSVIGVGVALLAAVLSALRPALNAAMMGMPSRVKRVKLPEKERVKREKELFKVYLGREYSMPIKVHEREEAFFFSFFTDRLEEFAKHYYERVEDIATDERMMVDGTLVKKIGFTYTFIEEGTEYSTVNELVARKRPKTDFYSLYLTSKPKVPGIPERAVEITISTIRDILLDWDKRKNQIMYGSTR